MLYGSILNIFKNEKDNSYVVIWKIDGEFVPAFYLYFIKDGKLKKIGEWEIIELPGEIFPDYLDYAVNDIYISKKNDEIEFSFLKDVKFIVFRENFRYSDDWGIFEADKLKISFNIVNGMLKKIEK
jgi:hypothetical protein